MLHAFARDGFRVAWSQWTVGDPPPVDVQDPIGAAWGGDDEPWGITLSLLDAKEIAGVFKLPVKEAYASPVSVEHVPEDLGQAADGHAKPRAQLRVRRDPDTGRSALTGHWKASDLEFPDLREQLARWTRVKPVRSIAYQASLLADFELVRPRGPMRLTFTGETSATLVEIGDRFRGLVMPVRTEREEAKAQ